MYTNIYFTVNIILISLFNYYAMLMPGELVKSLVDVPNENV